MYDGRGRVSSYTYPELDREELVYDDRNNTIMMRKWAKPGSAEAGTPITIEATWDPTYNKIATLTDANGQVTTFEYGPATYYGKGQISAVKLPKPTPTSSNPTWGFTYRSFGLPWKITDPSGVRTEHGYDSRNYVLTTVVNSYSLALTTTFTTNDRGDPTQIDGPRTDVADVSRIE